MGRRYALALGFDSYMELLWFRQKKSDEMIAEYSKMNENVRSTNMMYNDGIITNSIEDDYRGEAE